MGLGFSNLRKAYLGLENERRYWGEAVHGGVVFGGGGTITVLAFIHFKRCPGIDGSWQKIMQRAHETTNVIQCCVGDETLGKSLLCSWLIEVSMFFEDRKSPSPRDYLTFRNVFFTH